MIYFQFVIYHSLSAAAACVRHPAAHAIIIHSLFIYHLVPAAAACVRYPTDDASHLFIYLLLICSLSFCACSSSMREASCGNMMPPILIY
jgi:hypothetical protein